MERLLKQPSVVQRFEKLRDEQAPPAGQESPLVAAAQAFASHLNGPPAPSRREPPAPLRKVERSIVRTPRARVIPSAKFTLEGTSYYENQPDRSIALISEPGSPDRNQYWVREGERLGRFVIHEIRQGFVVYRDENEKLHEIYIGDIWGHHTYFSLSPLRLSR
ncbi:MAG: hypothetical protein ACYTE3_24145 [Planctomycetota bacterium]